MRRKKWVSKLLQILLLVSFMLILFQCVLFSLSEDQIKSLVKRHTFYLVNASKDQLLPLVRKYAQEDRSFMIHQYQRGEDKIPYKKMKDKEVSRVFRNLNLQYIDYCEDGDTVFVICPYIQVLVDDYSYGFYYSEKDRPRGVGEHWKTELLRAESLNQKCVFIYEKSDSEGKFDLEYECEDPSFYHWYRTEKISEHWWYFEQIMCWQGILDGHRGEKYPRAKYRQEDKNAITYDPEEEVFYAE